MAHAKISDEKLFEGLIDVFRTHGYQGATMSKLVQATGLERASLYHRFPGGKAEMACAVLEHVHAHFANDILAPLKEPGDPARRVVKMAKRIKEFFLGGQSSCILETMSVGGEKAEIQACVARMFNGWFNALQMIAIEAGFSTKEANRRAEDALVGIQGALVMNRALGLSRPFNRVLDELPNLLTKRN